jgi:hypothetical protein
LTARGFPPNARATNACGLAGAAVAAGLFESLGLGAWLAVALLIAADLGLLLRRPLPDVPLRTLGGLMAVAAGCTLLAVFRPDWVERPLWGPGGRVGSLGKLFSEAYLARTGAAILLTTLLGGGLFLACDAVLVRIGGTMAAAGIGLSTAIATAVGRYRSLSPAPAATNLVDVAKAFPGRRTRLPNPGLNLPEEPDADADDEPTIRVRRREPIMPEQELTGADGSGCDPDDTDDPSDTDDPLDPGDGTLYYRGGCACDASAPAGFGGGLAAVALLLTFARRRRLR